MFSASELGGPRQGVTPRAIFSLKKAKANLEQMPTQEVRPTKQSAAAMAGTGQGRASQPPPPQVEGGANGGEGEVRGRVQRTGGRTEDRNLGANTRPLARRGWGDQRSEGSGGGGFQAQAGGRLTRPLPPRPGQRFPAEGERRPLGGATSPCPESDRQTARPTAQGASWPLGGTECRTEHRAPGPRGARPGA